MINVSIDTSELKTFVQNLPQLKDQIFVKGKKLRKRFECKVHNSHQIFRVLGVAEVERVKNEE